MKAYALVALLLFAAAEQYVNATWDFGNIPGQGGFSFGGLIPSNFPIPINLPRRGGNMGQGAPLPKQGSFARVVENNNRFSQPGNSPKVLVQGFYNNTCPQAETIVRDIVRQHFNSDPTIAAGILRIFFHDCFVRGCDASILLDSTPSGEPPEKFTIANGFTLHGLDVIDAAKSALEATCPGVVSCADILSFASRDVSVLAGVRNFPMVGGRRDGTVSRASEVSASLPDPFSTVSQMTEMFNRKGFSQAELVVLLGAHSIGGAHCFTFTARLYNVTDPALEPNYAKQLKSSCPQPGSNNDISKDAKVDFDPVTPMMLDASYYKQVQNGKGLLASDNTLMTDRRTKEIVERMIADPEKWKRKFSIAMVRLSSLDVLVGQEGQIRKQCRAVNT